MFLRKRKKHTKVQNAWRHAGLPVVCGDWIYLETAKSEKPVIFIFFLSTRFRFDTLFFEKNEKHDLSTKNHVKITEFIENKIKTQHSFANRITKV